jgi:hypothetical protein
VAGRSTSCHNTGRQREEVAGHVWEIQDRSRNEWEFAPVGGNPEPRRTVPAPGYESDPFELSNEELQRMLDAVRPADSRTKRSPFLD